MTPGLAHGDPLRPVRFRTAISRMVSRAHDEPIPLQVLIRRTGGAELPLPAPATPGSSGLDLRACVPEPVVLPPGGRALIGTGIAIALPAGWEAQIRPRSGLADRHWSDRRSLVRHEAHCCIPGSAGMNSKGGSWVQWLTQSRKVTGTAACQEISGRVQTYGTAR